MQLTEVKGMVGNIYNLTAEELWPLVVSLQVENDRLKSEHDGSSEEIAKITAERDRLVAENLRLAGEHDRLSVESVRLTDENEQLRQDVEKLTRLAQEKQQHGSGPTAAEAVKPIMVELRQLSSENTRVRTGLDKLVAENGRLSAEVGRLAELVSATPLSGFTTEQSQGATAKMFEYRMDPVYEFSTTRDPQFFQFGRIVEPFTPILTVDLDFLRNEEVLPQGHKHRVSLLFFRRRIVETPGLTLIGVTK